MTTTATPQLVVYEDAEAFDASAVPAPGSIVNRCTRKELLDYPILEPFKSVLVPALAGSPLSVEELTAVKSLLVPQGTLNIHSLDQAIIKTTKTNLLLSGFLLSATEALALLASKPSFLPGAAMPLAKNGKLQPTEDELVDEDDLLTAEDRQRPQPAMDCGPSATATKKACKNCSCGLAELEARDKAEVTADTTNAKSSCGNCYLGDAFRCGGCPYRGLPAFKPGEQVQIPTDLLQDDI